MEKQGRLDRLEAELLSIPFLPAAGVLYLGLGVLFGAVWLVGGVQCSLFPTGWIFPVVLVVTGALMLVRRRFDIVITLWGGLTLAVFYLDLTIFMDALAVGFDQLAGFDATVIVAAFGLVPLVLRPQFRRST
jgi:hypothetical protein